jgi:hypothetical protein
MGRRLYADRDYQRRYMTVVFEFDPCFQIETGHSQRLVLPGETEKE